ncbi:dihydrodipicolinate synthase family protein [Roseateles violae]|uniref:Dihydrodipicolinate synthase family protein n=1 Tax=Roseateles violae TaxID=3058042 RepID=A0ABT8E038_9BURK|nr:dihydrodipicolinate synthase family protein [Pelomonas sp. PFR6]MDN3923207.1 dihydrodipicolinate synthase family protein [Pelomonas sp. PFR6]
MFEGIFTAVVTPMEADGSLIPDQWSAQIRRQVDAGIHGLIIGGTTGEFYALTVHERIEQFQRASKLLGRGTPWLAGVNAITTAEVLVLARAAREAGASGLLLGAPPYASPTQDELAEHCIEVDKVANLPIVLYNYPARTNADMGDEFMKKIAGRSNFVAIKESTGDMKRAQAQLRDFPSIKLCCGSEDLALDFFALGAKMWICATSNFAPQLILDLYRSCVIEGDFQRGREIAARLAPLTDALEQGGKFISAVKHACSRLGYCGPSVRRPLLPLNAQEADLLESHLARL